MLEEDAIRFDTFLKENDKKAHEAIKKAEKEVSERALRQKTAKLRAKLLYMATFTTELTYSTIFLAHCSKPSFKMRLVSLGADQAQN